MKVQKWKKRRRLGYLYLQPRPDYGLAAPLTYREHTTGLPTYSDTIGTREKCHCKRVSV